MLPTFDDDAATAEMLKQIDARAAHLEKVDAEVREWEKKTAKSAETELKSRAAKIANELAQSHAGKNFCVVEVPDADGKLLQAVVDALKSKFKGPIFLAGTRDGSVALVAYVPAATDCKIPGEQIDSTDRAHCRRKRRRTSGERAGRREGRQQDQRGTFKGSRARELKREPARAVVILSGAKNLGLIFVKRDACAVRRNLGQRTLRNFL